MARFRNPANGYEETTGAKDFFGTFFLGFIYLAARGQWPHALASLAAMIVLVMLMGTFGKFLAFIVWVVYAAVAPDLIAGHYRKNGWIEVSADPEAQEDAIAQASGLLGEKICPECAETVKGAAQKCRYCGHEFYYANF